jgi:hypothetical protein
MSLGSSLALLVVGIFLLLFWKRFARFAARSQGRFFRRLGMNTDFEDPLSMVAFEFGALFGGVAFIAFALLSLFGVIHPSGH